MSDEELQQSLVNLTATMDTQVVLAVLGTVAGIVSAYYGYLQYQKSRDDNTNRTPVDAAANKSTVPQQAKLWSTAVEQAIENFRKTRRDCRIEIAEQKNFDKAVDRFSTSELVLHVRYQDADNQEAASLTHRFELKINKDGDILEIVSKGKRGSDNEKFR